MKRIHKLFILALITIAVSLVLAGCDGENQTDSNELQLISSYELVAAKVGTYAQTKGDFSGMYVICFGGISGEIETTQKTIYNYWYKREDGGIIPATIDMSSYRYPECVTIVIYEDDSTTPKVEIWRDEFTQSYGDGRSILTRTEFRFTIPSGSFVNTYDLQGITNNS